jgi:anti-anti-sigma regulatory factor
MLRITTKEDPDSFVFALEGRLCGAWADEARRAWLRLREPANGHPIVLELAGVTFVDKAGESVLAEILSAGAVVHSSGVLISHIVERLRQGAPGGVMDGPAGPAS